MLAIYPGDLRHRLAAPGDPHGLAAGRPFQQFTQMRLCFSQAYVTA
jgi:hypothetical protein